VPKIGVLIAAMLSLPFDGNILACRYRLVTPSTSYSSTFRSLQVKHELAVRCRAVLLQEPTAAVEVMQQRVLAARVYNDQNDMQSRGFQLPELQAEASFLAGQMATLQAVRVLRQSACFASQPAVDCLCALVDCFRSHGQVFLLPLGGGAVVVLAHLTASHVHKLAYDSEKPSLWHKQLSTH